jgi:hypothetical protein
LLLAEFHPNRETAGDQAMCGYAFKRDQEYMVYAYGSPQGLATGICDRTRLLSEAGDDLAAFGPGRRPVPVPVPVPVPEETTPGIPPVVLLFSSLTLLSAVALLVARRFVHQP